MSSPIPSGANLPQGIASAILAEAPLDGRLRHEIAVLEVDEAFGPGLAKRLVPHSVLLINVQVDQLNRFYEPDRVVGMLESFAGVATRHLVVNADDHNLVDLAHRLADRGRRAQRVRAGARAAGRVVLARARRQPRAGDRGARPARRADAW